MNIELYSTLTCPDCGHKVTEPMPTKIKGDLTRHKHDDEDEMFLILDGNLRVEYEDYVVKLEVGDFHIVPGGTMHNPVCDDECLIALIETVTTKHTGDKVTDRTKSLDEQLGD